METTVMKWVVLFLAPLGIMGSDLPDVAAYQAIILVISGLIRWSKDQTWWEFLSFLGLAQLLGVAFFATNWDNIYLVGNFPITGIAVFMGVILSFPKEMVLKIKNFKIGKW